LFAVMLGFAAIWHIWWLVIIGLLAVVVTAAVFGWSEHREFELPAADVARMDRARLSPGTAA
jgi:cytochrome o ubiquinol oxidase subunit 1